MTYQYDGDNNISVTDEYTDPSNMLTIEYAYNQNAKPVVMKQHVKDGDLYGNTFGSNNDTLVVTNYNYDLNGNLKSVTNPNNVTTTYTYDKMDRQLTTSISSQDEYGNAVNVVNSKTYNWDGKVLTSKDANDHTTTYSYDQRDFLKTVTDAKGGVTSYYYDLVGRKIAEVSPKNYDASKSLANTNRTEFSYDLMNRLKSKTEKYIDPTTSQWVTINTKSYQYDAKGNTIKELDAIGYEEAAGSTLDEKINAGNGTDYKYDLQGNVISVNDPATKDMGSDYSKKYSYDALGRKINEIKANGVVIKNYYDDADNITKVTVSKHSGDVEKAVDQKTYDLLGNMKTQTDGNGNTTTYTYNAFKKMRTAIYSGDTSIPQNTVNFQYDKLQNLKWKKDSAGSVSKYSYNNENMVISSTEMKQDGTEAVTTTTRYDKAGNERFVTDGNGVTTEYRYDELNKKASELIYVTDSNNNKVLHTTSYNYDANGNLGSTTDWRGNVSSNKYDPLNRVIEKDNAYGKAIQRLVYNGNSIQIKSYDALDNVTQFVYDKNNRLLTTIYPKGNSTKQSYDLAGNIKTKTDGRDNTTTYNYDEFDNLAAVTNAKGETTAYTYDLNGNKLTQTDGKGNVKTFTYNVADKPLTKTDGAVQSASRTEKYTYYSNGLLKSKLDKNGKTTIYIYDSHGRIKSQTAGSTSISYSYDNNGNQLSMVDKTGTTIRKYDELNRVKSKTVPKFGETTFLYDVTIGMDTGCTGETSTDPKGNVTSKVYDKVGRLINVTAEGKVTSYTYYDNGNQKSVITDGVSSEDYVYDSNDRIKSIVNKNPNGSVIDSYSYTYDAADNQLTKTDQKGLTSYEYDELNRLSTVTEPNSKTTSYLFDQSGNRSRQTVTTSGGIEVTNYFYNDQNRLSKTEEASVNGSKTSVNYVYDNNGNLVYTGNETLNLPSPSQTTGAGIILVGLDDNKDKIKASYYEYDELNQQIKAMTNGKTCVYTYNGDGIRVQKEISGSVTRYLYEADKVVLESDDKGNQTARNVYGLNLIKRNVGSDTMFYLYNGHADVVGLVNATGQAVASYYYDAFGNIMEQTGSVNNPIRYAGYQYDMETGLYYLNARMYDPVTARFMQEDDPSYGDPNDPLSLNLYTYCHNEPIMYRDTNGHREIVDQNKNGQVTSTYLITDKKTGSGILENSNGKKLSVTTITTSVGKNNTSTILKVTKPTITDASGAKIAVSKTITVKTPTREVKTTNSAAISLPVKPTTSVSSNVNITLSNSNQKVAVVDAYKKKDSLTEGFQAGLQVVGGATETLTGFGFATGATAASGGLAGGFAVTGGSYLMADGTSNAAEGLQRITDLIFDRNSNGSANVVKDIYKLISPKNGEKIYNGTEIAIGVFCIAKGVKDVATKGVKAFGSVLGAEDVVNGVKTWTQIDQAYGTVSINVWTDTGKLVKNVEIDLTNIIAGSLLIGVDSNNTKSSVNSVKSNKK